MKVRVPSKYEGELQKLGCNWSVISWAWIVPVVAREKVLALIEQIKAEGLFCDVF